MSNCASGSAYAACGRTCGKISDMTERIAAFYDEELSRWIDWFTRLFEPIFELAGNIQ